MTLFVLDGWRGAGWMMLLPHLLGPPVQCEKKACNTSSSGIVSCMPNHHGPLCSVCDKGFSRSGDGGCKKCPNVSANYGA